MTFSKYYNSHAKLFFPIKPSASMSQKFINNELDSIIYLIGIVFS